MNSILKQSLTRIGLPSVLEPVGLTRDRRRPNGLTLNPWYRGKNLVWDATVVDTFAESHYIVSAALPGSVATYAETDKCWKYSDLLDNYYFQPVAIETTGVYGKSTAPFFSCLAKKLVDILGVPRERQWLHQCLSLAVVRGYTACLSSVNGHCLPNVCVFCELYCLQYVFYAFRKASVQYCFALLFSHPD